MGDQLFAMKSSRRSAEILRVSSSVESKNFVLQYETLIIERGSINNARFSQSIDIALLKVQYNISDFAFRITKQVFDFALSLILILLCLYPLIYLINKFTSKKNDIFQFILGIPKVLKGEKSFVGPRASSYYGELYVGKIGLTGLWYVENLSVSDEEEMKSLDLFYAKNQNVWLDLEILGRTVSKMFFKTEQ